MGIIQSRQQKIYVKIPTDNLRNS